MPVNDGQQTQQKQHNDDNNNSKNPTSSSTTTSTSKTEHEEHLEGMVETRNEIFSRSLRVKVWSIDNPDAPAVSAITTTANNNVKIVHFVRHGQGFHNLMADVYRSAGKKWTSNIKSPENPYTMPELVDSPLTELGRKQAINLQDKAKTMKYQPQLVVLSPNCRALHTGLLVWEHLIDSDNDDGVSGGVPFIAHEMVREEHGVHVCDQRRSVTRQSKEFPNVDFTSFMLDDEDPLWQPDKRETKQDVADRAYKFLRWLYQRPEKHVGVASHSAWLLTLFNACLDCQDEDDKLLDWFETGELRSVVLEFQDNNNNNDNDDDKATNVV